MEVKIGVQAGARELVVDTELSAEELARTLGDTLAKGGIFSITDSKGRQLLIPVDKLAYIEIEPPSERAVGFGRI